MEASIEQLKSQLAEEVRNREQAEQSLKRLQAAVMRGQRWSETLDENDKLREQLLECQRKLNKPTNMEALMNCPNCEKLEREFLSALAAIEKHDTDHVDDTFCCIDVDISALHKHDKELLENATYIKCAKCSKPALRYSSTIDGLRCQACGVAYLNCEQVKKREASLTTEVRKPLVEAIEMCAVNNAPRNWKEILLDALAKVKEQ